MQKNHRGEIMQELQNNITYEKVNETDMVKGRYRTLDRTIDRLVQILYMPSFGAQESWEVFRKSSSMGSEIRYFVVNSMYFEAVDIDTINSNEKLEKYKFSNPFMNPMMRRQIFDIDESYISSILTQIKALKLSPMPDMGSYGVDGATYELLIENLHLICRYSWWESGTDDWRDMIILVNNILRDLKELKRKI